MYAILGQKEATTKLLNAGEASTIMNIPIGTRITGPAATWACESWVNGLQILKWQKAIYDFFLIYSYEFGYLFKK